MASSSALKREETIQSLQQNQFDLLVIGGGITGCGIALDAVSRGLKVALIEKKDFASGTSSKSTKLIHGGLRYLKQFEVRLVREVGQERSIVHRLAPHLVLAEKMLLPIVKNGTFGKWMTAIGLKVYDILAGVGKEDQRKMLNKAETLAAEPLLPESIVIGGGLYAEYRTDDARLTIEIAKTAIEKGAQILNYVQADSFIYEDGRIVKTVGTDMISGEQIEIAAKYTVSATGPWVDELRSVNKSLEGKHLFLSKGVHIVFPHHVFPIEQAIYFDVPDGRMIFAIPRGRTTYVGTTDTHYTHDKDDIRTTISDVQYLLDGIQNTFPQFQFQLEDVISSWAGVRPLIYEAGKSASEISRKDEIFESETGLISIAGGKLTGYRKMAQKVVDLIAKKLKQDHQRTIGKCQTARIKLVGGPFKNAAEVAEYIKQLEEEVDRMGLDAYAAQYLVNNFGRQSSQIIEIMKGLQDEDPRIVLARAELEFCVKNELVVHPLDFFNRRTGRLYFEIDTIQAVLEAILLDFKQYFGLSDDEISSYRISVLEEIKRLSIFEA